MTGREWEYRVVDLIGRQCGELIEDDSQEFTAEDLQRFAAVEDSKWPLVAPHRVQRREVGRWEELS